MSKRFIKNSQKYTQDLSTGPLSFTTTFGKKPFRTMLVTLKATQAISETVTISLDSVNGSAFDVLICSVDLVAERNFFYKVGGDLELLPGDQLVITCSDDNSVGSVSGEVRASETKS